MKSRPNVWSLNYHEALGDARVIKEAVSLAAKYNVTVFCDRPSGFSKHTEFEDVKINRFEWKDLSLISHDDFQNFDYLTRARKVAEMEFRRLANHTENLRELRRLPSDISVLLEDPRLYREHYKSHLGKKRKRLKLEHLTAWWGLKVKAKLAPSIRKSARLSILNESLTSRHQRIAKEVKEANQAFWNLYQLKSLVFAANFLRQEFEGVPDIVHAHDIFTLPAGVVLAKQYGAKLIYDAHELETERATNVGPAGRDIVDRLERDCLDHVDALITVSDGAARFYANRYKGSFPTVVMNAPVVELTPEEAVARKLDVRSMAGLEEDVPLLVYTGGIQREHRGLDKVIEAISQLPKCHLATLGPRHARDDNWLLQHAKAKGILDRVHMFDSVPHDHVVGTIASASAAIIPIQGVSLSYQMAMPNKLFEAAAAKLPILISDLPDMRAFVEELDIGLVMDHTSADGIKSGIERFLSGDRDTWISDRTDDLLSTKYSWSAQTKNLHTLYAELLC